MTLSKKYGRLGEELAKNYLIEKGFQILEENYRFGRREIDLIALKEDQIIFIEVKFRRSQDFGFPETFVSESQITRIQDASSNYLWEKELDKPIRFDIISIDGQNKVEHIEDAF